MTDLQRLQQRQKEFVRSRNWEQFHTPKSIAMSISVEAGELLEVFQWHDDLPAAAYDDSEIRRAVEEEVADVVIYALSMASAFEIDLEDAVESKIDRNDDRFDAARSAEIRQDLSRWQSDGADDTE